jgi:hypothetical protein
LGTDLYDSLQGNLKALAFQAKGQDCAYVPDSALGKPDKLNVRDGHYPLWGRFHFFIGRSGGTASSNDAQDFVYELTKANLDTEIFTAFVTANLVPACAMQVRRDTELGDLAFDNPAPHACGCVFDLIAQKLDHPPTGCNPCTKNEDCQQLGGPRQYCNYNFCEASQ